MEAVRNVSVREPAVALLNPAPNPAMDWRTRAHTAGDSSLGQLAFAGLWLFVFVMPWEEAVPLWGGFVISRWIALLAGTMLAIAVLASHHLRRLSPLHGWMLAFVGWGALTLFWTVDSPSTITRVGTYAQLLLAVWMMWELATTDQRILSLLKAYMLGATVIAVSTIVNFINGTQSADLVAEKGGFKYHDDRYTMLGVNENDLGLMLALSLPIAIYLLMRNKSKGNGLLCGTHIGLCLTALFLSGSRGGMISTVVAMSLFVLLFSRLARWQRTSVVALLAVGVMVGIALAPQDTKDRFLDTATQIDQGTMTHRTVLWRAGLDVFRDHAWTGVGAGAYAPAIVRAVDKLLVAHNSFLSILVELGVPGLLLFAVLLAGLFHCAWRFNSADRSLWLVLLVTWCVGASSLTWEYRKPTWFVFGLLIAHAYSRRATRFAE
jgi:O-antigen ligase